MNRRMPLNGDDWLFKDFYGEGWRLGNSHAPDSLDRRGWRTGSVPGCPHHDLWRLGEIPDPYIERNSLLCEWIPQRTWLYKKEFTVDEKVKGQCVQLHFEGVDYQAEFFLNGESLGTHIGMFTPAAFDVTEKLRYGSQNLLAVVIEAAPFEESQVGRTSRVHTSKTRMNYWWDFCPRLIHLGIWDDVYLELTGPVHIADVFVRPRLSARFHHAEVAVTTELHSVAPITADVEVTLRYGGAVIARQQTRHSLEVGHTKLESCLDVIAPRLWWPNGYGKQELYEADVRVTLPGTDEVKQEDISAFRSISFGIRQIELAHNESAAAAALPYTFVVNGRKIYAKGWNWVPMDVMYSLPQPAKLEHLLTLAKNAHVNLLRVWGGGLIEREAFYKQCDHLGILVWQEFIQSSSGIDNLPSTSPEYLDMVRECAEQIIPRKRNHPSLAVWCGGNELSGDAVQPLDDSHPALAALKTAVKRLDPDRLWRSTSPSGPIFGNSLETIARAPSGLHDVHGPWEFQGVTKQYELYNRGASLFHSEFGVEGITNLRALNATLTKKHQLPVDLDNPYWFHRGAWWVKRREWDTAFGEMHDIKTLVRATQFMQADGLRYALEADRRRKYHNSGTLPWQFNEPYPMAACTSAVDYYGHPKPAYYTVASAYAPLLISATFDTLAWGGCAHFEVEAWVCNSREQSYKDTILCMRLIGTDGGVYAERTENVSFDANAASKLTALRESLASISGEVFFLDLQLLDSDGALLGHNRYTFSRASNLAPLLACPPTKLCVSSLPSRANIKNESIMAVTNNGQAAAMFIWLEDARDLRAPGSAYFDHNYFCLLPGEERIVTVTWKDVPACDRRLEISGWNIPSLHVDQSRSG